MVWAFLAAKGSRAGFPPFRYRSSLLTSLRWPAAPPFQSGLGFLVLKKAKTKILLCDTIVDVIDKAKIKDSFRWQKKQLPKIRPSNPSKQK